MKSDDYVDFWEELAEIRGELVRMNAMRYAELRGPEPHAHGTTFGSLCDKYIEASTRERNDMIERLSTYKTPYRA